MTTPLAQRSSSPAPGGQSAGLVFVLFARRPARLLAVAGTALARGAFDAGRERAGAREVENVEVHLGHLSIEGDCLVREGEGERDCDVGLDYAEFAGRDRDACLAARVDRVDRGGLGC